MFARFARGSAAVVLTAAAALSQKTTDAKPAKADLAAGSQAPALSIEKWVKGSPVKSFEKGKTYVVEFWATWCGPCVASMPHLSALQRQYKSKGVTVIGVTSRDPRNDLAAVEAMVKSKGDGMDYTVAWDDDRKTGTAFMKAAGRSGIPCAFVIDGQGKVAFIGHPGDLDSPLEQIVAGTWDIEKGNAAISEVKSRIDEIHSTIPKDAKGALAKIGEFEAKYPAFASQVASLKFDALLASGDFTTAYAWGGKLVDEAIEHKDVGELNDLAWKIVDPAAKWERLDLDLALRAAGKGVELTQYKDGAILDTLARVQFLKGDVKKAIQTETLAIEQASGPMKQDFEKTLAEYKAKGAQ